MTLLAPKPNIITEEKLDVSRRRLVMGGLAAILASNCAPVFIKSAQAARKAPARVLSFYNLHTGEKARVAYWENGHYVRDAMMEINRVLRDHRTGDVHKMDPELMDLLCVLHKKLGSSQPYQIISGYRSPASNAMLREHSNGVAKKSMHMEGKAVDIVLEDRGLKEIRTAAKSLERGGVGYYPGKFVHVDTGAVRAW